MPPEIPDRLLGISIDDPSDRESADDTQTDEEELERFLFIAIGDHRLALPVDDVKTITDPPDEADVTRVPRSPLAVDGLVDLRGEIAAVIDARVHFPVEGSPPPTQRLVVFDRPTDQQAAAIRVDEVLGVHTIPARNVLEADAVDDPTVAGGAIEHPLILALIEQENERERKPSPRRDRSSRRSRKRTRQRQFGAAGTSRAASTPADEDGVVADEFLLEEPTSDLDDGQEQGGRTVVVEATGVVDVSRLLLASGSEA
ncbi:chemotaxis protein CheW [Natronosalvus vescus]|uniref:chemotaxis protein CheW n=1 Tax=Natronosalvus vescus TaxID=2953881 RepID=UPI0020906E42|nr:chemotaxis protein CheW [Natronosalvus vescus]